MILRNIMLRINQYKLRKMCNGCYDTEKSEEDEHIIFKEQEG